MSHKSAKNTSGVEHIPTFLLRGCSHQEIYKKYCQDDFSKITRVHDSSMAAAAGSNGDNMGRNVGVNGGVNGGLNGVYGGQMVHNSMDSRTLDKHATMKIKTRSNHTMTVLMSNSVQIKNYDGSNLSAGGWCDWTREKITGIPVGIPVKSCFDPVKRMTTYFVVGQYQNFECAYAALQHHLKNDNSGIYKESIVLLRNLFKTIYPNDELVPAGPYNLHQNWGGPMTNDDFIKNAHQYVKSGTIRICPAQIQYIENMIC